MGGKDKGSRKAEEKKKEKIIEDKTFGLKNKNRSAKVQAFVQQVQTNVKRGNPDDRKRQEAQASKKEEKEAKKKFEAEMAALFRAAPQPKKSAEEERAEETDRNMGVDPNEYLWRPEDFEDIEADDTRLEETLEAERAALAGRTDLTPVTEETFRAWRERKKKEAVEKELQRIRKAKAAGMLRGWDLWQTDQSLFVDDEDAEDVDAYVREENEEMDSEDLDFGESDAKQPQPASTTAEPPASATAEPPAPPQA